MALPYTVSGILEINDTTSQPTTFFNDNSNTINLRPPVGLPTTYTMTLPIDEGVDPSILQTDGVNQTSWQGTIPLATPQLPATDVNDSVTFTTSSTTPVVITSMTQTLTAGVYAVYFSGVCVPDNTTIEYGIYNNGVLEIETFRELEVVTAAATDRFNIATHGFITIPSTQDVDVRINVTTISTSIDILDRSLSTLRLED